MITIPIQIIINEGSRGPILKCLESLGHLSGLGDKFKLHLFLLSYEEVSYGSELQSYITKKTSENLKFHFTTRIKKSGFGENHNFIYYELVKKHCPNQPFVLILNPDTFMWKSCLERMLFWQQEKQATIVEACQFPSEHPKAYDTKTLEVNWCSFACVLISTQTFEALHGFDEVFFMYCEDVDMSWRNWIHGGKCIYAPDAVICHMTNLFHYHPYSFSLESYYALRNHLVLAWKFFGSNKCAYLKYEKMFTALNIPVTLKENIWKDFQQVKKEIKQIDKTHSKVEIKKLGLFHELRF